MSGVKIVEGGYYLTHDGIVCGPAHYDPHPWRPAYPWLLPVHASCVHPDVQMEYSDDGHYLRAGSIDLHFDLATACVIRIDHGARDATAPAAPAEPASATPAGGGGGTPEGRDGGGARAALDTTTSWHWYAGRDEENYPIGPCDTRADALAAAIAEECGIRTRDAGGWELSIHLVEARKDPLRLAKWIDIDRMLELVEDDISESDRGSEHDDGPFFDLTTDQADDLEARIACACDEWQDAHAIRPQTWTFSALRNQEHVVVPLEARS